MSRPRTMGAGLAGSMTKNVNVNLIQFGDKLQGLPPQATHFFIAGNGNGGWNNYRTRANGNKRNFVFCMNQLGGVGRAMSQFKIDGVNNPDGAHRCTPYPYNIIQNTGSLLDNLRGRFPNYQLAFVDGNTSTLQLAQMGALDLSNPHLDFSARIQSLISYINQHNGHGYMLVVISKDTTAVSNETLFGLPVYVKDDQKFCFYKSEGDGGCNPGDPHGQCECTSKQDCEDNCGSGATRTLCSCKTK